jgi:hypothetical protein
MRPLSADAGTIGLMDDLSPDPDEATLPDAWREGSNLARSDIEAFPVDGLDVVSVERVYPDKDPRWRATHKRR